MEHVGVRQHEVRVLADQRPLGLGRVAVVDGRPDLRQLQLADLAQLVARERLRREQVQGGRFRYGDRRFREREVVDEGLPARRAGRDDHVRARSGASRAPALMRVQPLMPISPRRRRRARAGPRGTDPGVGSPRGQLAHAAPDRQPCRDRSRVSSSRKAGIHGAQLAVDVRGGDGRSSLRLSSASCSRFARQLGVRGVRSRRAASGAIRRRSRSEDHERRAGDRGPTRRPARRACDDSGNEGAEDELRPEEAEQERPPAARATGSSRIATAKTDCAAVRNSSSRCSALDRQAVELDAREIANTIGSVPTSSVHWFTFDDTSVPRPAFVFSRHANRPATSSSGASDASGASHWTSRNSLMPSCCAGRDQRLGERLRARAG